MYIVEGLKRSVSNLEVTCDCNWINDDQNFLNKEQINYTEGPMKIIV